MITSNMLSAANLSNVNTEVTKVFRSYNLSPEEIKKFIKNPTNKYSVINNVIEALTKHFSFSDLFSRFLKVLNKNRRFFFVEKIVNNFFDLLLNERGEVLATLKLSHTITDSEKADIAKKLDDILRRNILYQASPIRYVMVRGNFKEVKYLKLKL